LPIRERVRRANGERAEAFVSLHLNASPDRTQRGYETYVLSREAADREAREIALREGAASGDTAAIVADLRQEASEIRAARLGRADRGLKQASLDVLKGHVAPAVLVEVGFIDHAEEGIAIVTPEMRERIAAAITAGILAFLKEGRK
jgi:N-acetylmuramoyl-L-alanine amidase